MLKKRLLIGLLLVGILFFFQNVTCKYSTKDPVAINPNIKTFRVTIFENKARYVNNRLAVEITEGLRRKIISNTKLKQTSQANADFDISGTISGYDVNTQAVNNNQSSGSRLNVSVDFELKNNKEQDKNIESTVQRFYDFKSNINLQEADRQRFDEIVKNVVDDIFNKIFINW